MPPPKGTPNILEGPGDYDVTVHVHNDTYPAIDPTKADLSGKVVFISGGSRGLGRAMALAFAKAGASSIAVGARSDLSSLANDIRLAAVSANRGPPKFLPVQLDVTDRQSVEQAASTVEREFGHCDVVVSNAGILGKFGLVVDSDPDEWRRVLDVNLYGPYLISRSFLPLLLKAGGPKYLIHVTSVAAHLVNPMLSAYQTSKVGVMRFAQLLNAEYAAEGVICFSIHPGNCPTDIMGGPENLNEQEKLVFTETPDISADTLVYLTSERRDWLRGRYINCTWDMLELEAKKDNIVAKDLLKVRLVY
ncbi:hypothetical protein HO133_000922 [Letharia lupina]|uniref:Uncharacterized protein n=1 Tax=Letharia lupina TaxID=560253 RepID=A0A8H6CGR4_9LECA|nr:uncharacterized protein HO133_000922 [Letharia lupina]KAF6222871.1 hypothetical protein HO133_000922 [Letharia lupina]